MYNTTPAPSFESIDSAALLFVSGGCHKRRCCCPMNQQTIVNVPQPAPQVAPQVLPQPAPAPAAPEPMAAAPQGPSGDVVMTNVSINGQPVS